MGAPLFGDPPVIAPLPGLENFRMEPQISYEFLRRKKAVNVPDGCLDSCSGDLADSGNAHEELHIEIGESILGDLFFHSP